MGEGFVKSLISVGNGLKELLIWFVIHIPQLVILGIIAFIMYEIIVKIEKKRIH